VLAVRVGDGLGGLLADLGQLGAQAGDLGLEGEDPLDAGQVEPFVGELLDPPEQLESEPHLALEDTVHGLTTTVHLTSEAACSSATAPGPARNDATDLPDV
jgi:hypothetical protein